jgi:hypothetical protein
MKLSTAVRLVLLRVTLTAATDLLKVLDDLQARRVDDAPHSGAVTTKRTVRATSAQIAAAKLIIKRAEWTQRPVRPAVRAIANARPSGAVTTKGNK